MERSRIFQALLAVAMFCIMTTAAQAGSYDRNKAASYAYNNALNDVTGSASYRVNGGDCTNFVSNALQAGGWTEIGKYFYTSNYAWYYDWYGNGGSSYTWGGANNFYRFLFYGNRAISVAGPSQLQIGDIVQMDKTRNGDWDHSMIITGKDSRGLLVSYHSTEISGYRRNEVLNDVVNRNPGARFMAWHLKDTY